MGQQRAQGAALDEAAVAALLDGVDGWLHPAEATVLHQAAYEAFARGGCAVEIGSWQGRSTIALAAAARAAGAGKVIAIDPHVSTDAFDGDANRAALEANLEARGLMPYTQLVRERSGVAAADIADGSVDVLFVDGDHSYEGASLDIDRFTPKLRPGAVVGFNDPQLPGVKRALIDRVAAPGSGYSCPTWVVSTMFFVHGEGEMGALDRVRMRAYMAALIRFHRMERRVQGEGRHGQRARLERFNGLVARRAFEAILPRTPVGGRGRLT